MASIVLTEPGIDVNSDYIEDHFVDKNEREPRETGPHGPKSLLRNNSVSATGMRSASKSPSTIGPS